MSSDKAQLAALGAHLAEQQLSNTIVIGERVYSADQLAPMVALWEEAYAPETPEEAAESEQSACRMEARRDLVRAAIKWYRKTDGQLINTDAPDSLPLELALKVSAFLAAGGNEVTG